MAGPLTDLFNTVASESGVAVERGRAFGPGPRDRADVYRPPAGRERAAVIVFYYGGGWTSGDRATYAFVGQALAARGYTTVIPDYRVFPEVRFPDFVADARQAYRWAGDQIACQGRRPVVVAGHSAGAWLAAMVALDRQLPTRPAALIGLAGPYAFDPTTWASTRAIFAPAAGHADRARPVAQVARGAPPTLLATAAADTTVKAYNADDFAVALSQADVVVERHHYDRIGHAGLVMAIARPLRWRASVLADMVGFIERRVADGNDHRVVETDARGCPRP
jgi:acetyl esterase/lipase